MLLVVTYKGNSKKVVPTWQIIKRDGTVVHDNLTREQGLKFIEEINNGKEDKDIPSD